MTGCTYRGSLHFLFSLDKTCFVFVDVPVGQKHLKKTDLVTERL